MVNPIQRVDVASLTTDTFFELYEKAGMPVVITGLLKECDWNLDYLCEKLGNQEFSYGVTDRKGTSKTNVNGKNIGSGIETQIMPFTKYAELLRSHKAHEKRHLLSQMPSQKHKSWLNALFKNYWRATWFKKAD
jgi:lysine-specific demethylase 8/hypoxia-inducible factor 1-alpha inhibitor (HIF hydroxylase)